MANQSAKGVLLSYFWAFSGQAAYFIISLLGNIVLARILGPEDFGQIGVIMFFILLGKILTESGLSGALIRMKIVSEVDYSTIFLSNIFLSLMIFLLLVLFSGPISVFYEDIALSKILIVASSVIIISSLQFVQNARLVREMRFKRKSVYETVSIGIAMTLGVFLATNGLGVWSVVFVHIGFSVILTLLLWTMEEPLRVFRFSTKSFKKLYKFGVNTTAASLLSTGFDNIYQALIARYFSIYQGGLFYQAKKLQEIPIQIFNAASQGVFFSAFSKQQDDKDSLVISYNRAFSILSTVIGFICLTLFIYAENFIMIIYGAKWVGATLMMQMMAVASFFFMQEQFNRILYKVFDLTDRILWLEVIKKIFQTVTIVIGLYLLDIQLLVVGLVITNVFAFALNSFFCKRWIFTTQKHDGIRLSMKLVTVGIVVYSLTSWLVFVFQLSGFNTFLLFPIAAGSYFLMVGLLGVIDKREILSLFKK